MVRLTEQFLTGVKRKKDNFTFYNLTRVYFRANNKDDDEKAKLHCTILLGGSTLKSRSNTIVSTLDDDGCYTLMFCPH